MFFCVHWMSIGFLLDFYWIPLDFHWILIGFPLDSNGNPMEIQWNPMGIQWESNGNPMEIQWNQRWLLSRGEEKKTRKIKIENELVSDVIYFRKTSQN